MNLIILFLISCFIQAGELNVLCERAHGDALDCLDKARREGDVKKDSLSVQVNCNVLIGQCLQECKKTPNDKLSQNRLKICKDELPKDVTNIVETLGKKEEALRGPLQNPAVNKGGFDLKKVGGENSKGAVIQYIIPTNSNPSNRSSGTK